MRELIQMNIDETDDPEELNFLEEALENLDFNEQIMNFDMLVFDEDPQKVGKKGISIVTI